MASPQTYTRKDLFTENDANSHTQGIAGYGVYFGLVASPGTGLQVYVSSGSAYFAGSKVTYVGGTVNLAAAHATLYRRDIIVMDSSGTISAVAGTPEARNVDTDTRFQFFNPYPPAIPSGKIILCEVYVAAVATGLASSDILDRRVLMDNDTLRSGENIVLKAGGTLNVFASDGVTLLFKVDESGNIYLKGRVISL